VCVCVSAIMPRRVRGVGYLRIGTHSSDDYVCVYMYIRVCMCVYIRVCVCVCVYGLDIMPRRGRSGASRSGTHSADDYVCVYIYMCVYIYVCVCVFAYMCVYVCQILCHGVGGVGYHVLEHIALMIMIIRRCNPDKIPAVKV